ncbi:mycothiol synthase [Leucobacter sp. UCMA 4100]|uniref:mycothiol synthase n=1 Tax=Leucobacter sp. UCMA 4100 TaxID=2810534 RepID=UPI0022EAAE1B|nr:mycothiol synthase [Leucobacter sp. UCMA 4100]MDA3146421.1 mycothiol synthase [Leucobacter sp. UCMA 4100]
MNEAMKELLRVAEAHDGFPAISDQAQREAASGAREIVTREVGDLTAVGIVGSDEVDLVVHPDARGRGLGSALLDELLGHAEGQAVLAWAHGENPAASHMLASRGFSPVRTLLRLELPGEKLAEVSVRPLADGLTLETYDSANTRHGSDLIGVNARAFASHPEQGQLTLAEFEQTTCEAWFDPKDLFLVYEGETLLAFSWIKTTRSVSGAVETELYVIGVDPEAAGRGLGTTLLGITMARMAEHRPERVTLYVEGDNEPALALYRHALFTTALRSTQWLRARPE